VNQLLKDHKSNIDIEEQHFQMLYYFLIKDRILMKFSIDFNDVKYAVNNHNILQDGLLNGMIADFEAEAYNIFEGNFKEQ
jgi:hypothetical protein